LTGCFLTVEGGEGVGKSTFIKQFVQALTQVKRIDVIQTFEPGGTPLANRLREIFNATSAGESMFVETEFLTVAAARAQHVRQLIIPALADGKWVVCDRYIDSSRIYQGVVGGLNRATIDIINEFATAGLQPHLTLLLDCEVDISLNRVGVRSASTDTQKSRFDAKPAAYHQKIRTSFLELARQEPNRFEVVDASGTTEEMVQNALGRLMARGLI
jgi:dTMP kinase